MRVSGFAVPLLVSLGLNQNLYGSIWSNPQLFTPANSNSQDWRVVFSPDNLSFYEESERDGHFADAQILRSTRPDTASPWVTPTPVTELNTSLHDHFYWMSQDQKEAFMARQDNSGHADIYKTTRSSPSSVWNTPTSVTELNNANTFEWHFHATVDGLHGVFSSSRSGGGGGSNDLWQTSRPDSLSPWTAPTAIFELNTAADERGPQFSADGLTLYFCRLGQGIFAASRSSLSDPFSAPVNQGFPSNAIDPTLSVDGNTIYYSVPNGSEFNYDIYFSTKPEPAAGTMLLASLILVNRRCTGFRRN